MLWIGLTGGMGCGKSTALEIFKNLGCGIESADRIVSKLYTQKNVLTQIGQALDLDTDNKIESLKIEISKKVFNRPDSLKKLEDILHPLVRKESEISKNTFIKEGKKISFYEVPLLFEKNLEKHFDKTLCIGASLGVQMDRIKLRNPNWSEAEIKNRLKAQLDLNEKKERSDFYIDNSQTEKELELQCRVVLKTLLTSL